MEYTSNFSDAEIEADANDERNKISSAHDNRLALYRNGAVSAEEIALLSRQLQGNKISL